MDGKRLALGRNAVRPAVDCFDKPPPSLLTRPGARAAMS